MDRDNLVQQSSMRRVALACSLLLMLQDASAARPALQPLQRVKALTSSAEPVVADPLHVSAGGCVLAHWPRSGSKQRPSRQSVALLHGHSLTSCSAADFSVRVATAAAITACSGMLPKRPDGRWAGPQWLVHSSCSYDAVITLQPQVNSGVRRALRQVSNGRSSNMSCSGPNCKVFILLIITFGVIVGAIATASVITKCGPCKFCWWAWRHRHDPPEGAAHHTHITSKGNPVVAAQLIGEVVAPCSSAHMDKLGSEECPVCLQSEGDWSLLPCGHAICNPCLAQLVKAQAMVTKCPLCRDPLLPEAEEHQAAGSSGSSAAGTVSARSSAFSRASTLSRSSSEAAGSGSGSQAAGCSSSGGGTSSGGGEAAGGSSSGLSPRFSRAVSIVRSSAQPAVGVQDDGVAAACSSPAGSSGAASPTDAPAAASAPAAVQLTSIAETPAAAAAASEGTEASRPKGAPPAASMLRPGMLPAASSST